jgi:hypothetical protein
VCAGIAISCDSIMAPELFFALRSPVRTRAFSFLRLLFHQLSVLLAAHYVAWLDWRWRRLFALRLIHLPSLIDEPQSR